MNRISTSFLPTSPATLKGKFRPLQAANSLADLLRKYRYFLVLIHLLTLLGSTASSAENRPDRDRSGVLYVTSSGFARASGAMSKPAACTTPTVSLANANANNCVGAASLSVSSSTSISKIEWYNGATLVYTSLPQAASSVTTVAGGTGQGSGLYQLDGPAGIYVDGTGTLFIADQNNHRIQKCLPGNTQGITVGGGNGNGTASNQLSFPADVFVDGAGTLYATTLNVVRRWLNGGGAIASTVAGELGEGSATNQLNSPDGVYVDGSGAVYIADANNHRVQKWVPGATSGVTVAGGNGQGSAANQLYTPTGLVVDGTGTVYVVDQTNFRVQKWIAGATSGVTVAGGNGAGSAANQLSISYGVTIDGTGAIYVGDSFNHRVQKWGGISPSYSPSTAGSYSAKVTDIFGCTVTTNSVVVAVPPTASISPVSGTLTCANPTTTLTASGGGNYRWDDNSTSAIRTVNLPGVYSVTVTTGGCSATATTTVVSNSTSLTISASASLSLANVGSIIRLSASGATSYQWIAPSGSVFTTPTNSSTVSASLTSAGVQTFTVVASNGGTCSQTALVSVTAIVGPDLTAIISLPDANFPLNSSKELLVQIQEVNGAPTTSGTIVITITAPAGYSVAFTSSTTSITVAEGNGVLVNNGKWHVSNTVGNQQLSLRINAGEQIGAHSAMNLSFTIRRTTASSGSVANITVNVADDGGSGYDVNRTNNIYARIIQGL